MIGLLAKTGFRFSSEFNRVVYVNGKSALSLSQMIGIYVCNKRWEQAAH